MLNEILEEVKKEGFQKATMIYLPKISLVLVAHNGYKFDFPILFSEIECHLD